MDDTYLPHIDIAEGKKRVMGNLKLYVALLNKFNLREMHDELQAAMAGTDFKRVTARAHALRGAAGNMSLPTLHSIAGEIEGLAKQGQSSAHLLAKLNGTVNAVEENIRRLSQ